jgi:uncharacterized SAM-binding protein YcdF (DUF218 family)
MGQIFRGIRRSWERVRQRLIVASESCGLDGVATLLLSTLVILGTGGLLLFWLLARVHGVARNTPCQPEAGDCLLVLGVRLHRGDVTPEFACRLDRAVELLRANSAAKTILLGGKTDPDGCSEAQAGHAYIVAHGIESRRITLEDGSRHTLENLSAARVLLAIKNVETPLLITSRYHLARSSAIAHGLGLRPQLCAAEPELRLDALTLLRLLRESHHLHWYYVGGAWARWTRSGKMLGRIS